MTENDTPAHEHMNLRTIPPLPCVKPVLPLSAYGAILQGSKRYIYRVLEVFRLPYETADWLSALSFDDFPSSQQPCHTHVVNLVNLQGQVVRVGWSVQRRICDSRNKARS